MSKAIEWGWIDRRPGKLNRFKEENSRLMYLTPDQIARMLDAKGDSNPQIYVFILIGVQTAMRRMEILSLRRDDIDVERRIISIRQAKTGPRQQPTTPALAEFLKVYIDKTLPKGTPWLFPSAGAKSGHAQDVRKAFRRVVSAAGLDCDQVVRHTLRHTAITHLVQSGIDLPTVQRISGHKTFAMVMRYSHANGAHIEAAMERLQERLKVA